MIPENAELHTYEAGRMYDHISYSERRHLERLFRASDQFGRLAQYLVENDYEQHLNLRQVPEEVVADYNHQYPRKWQ